MVPRPPKPEVTPRLRPACPAMDELIGTQFALLDEGFVSVINYMGTDDAVAEAARAYRVGSQKHAPDATLLRHLILHQHMSPLAAYSIKLHIKLPIFLARQWIRLRTSAITGMGGRYTVLEKEFHVPSAGWLGASATELENMAIVLTKLKAEALDVFREYEGTGVLGFSMTVPIDGPRHEEYTQLCWSVTLDDLLHFLHPHGVGENWT